MMLNATTLFGRQYTATDLEMAHAFYDKSQDVVGVFETAYQKTPTEYVWKAEIFNRKGRSDRFVSTGQIANGTFAAVPVSWELRDLERTSPSSIRMLDVQA